MAQAKKSRRTQKKSTVKTRFYLVKTVQETRERVTDKLEDYSQTYIERPIKTGKALVKDLKKAPRKTLSAWIDDGKETISDLNKETRATVSGMIKDGRAFLTKAGQKPRQTLNDVLDDGKAKIEDLSEDTRSRIADLKAETRSVLEGIGKDARIVVDEVVYGGRQTVALQNRQGGAWRGPACQTAQQKARSIPADRRRLTRVYQAAQYVTSITRSRSCG
jgi:gas vesicle protein